MYMYVLVVVVSELIGTFNINQCLIWAFVVCCLYNIVTLSDLLFFFFFFLFFLQNFKAMLVIIAEKSYTPGCNY